MKQKRKNLVIGLITRFCLVAEMGFEPHDLRVMSPTSYRAALLRDVYSLECFITILQTKSFVKCFFKFFLLYKNNTERNNINDNTGKESNNDKSHSKGTHGNRRSAQLRTASYQKIQGVCIYVSGCSAENNM